jgi:hypothetical protein
MKTNLAEASKAYQEHLRDQPRVPGRSCPTLERIVNCAMTRLSRKERAEIIGHAANCAICAAALKNVLELSGEMDRFAAELAAFSENRQDNTSHGKRAVYRAWLTRKPAVAVLIGIFAIAVLALSVSRLIDTYGTRRGPGTRVILISPVKPSLSGNGLQFQWESLTGADHYIVELFDKSLNLVWRSNPVHGVEVRPAGGVDKNIHPGEAYYWTVTAVTSNHTIIKSRLAEFSVKK